MLGLRGKPAGLLRRKSGLDPVWVGQALERMLQISAAQVRQVLDNVAGFGPLQVHLDDPGVEEIWINDRLTPG
ncbi:MAG: hypothetical protein Q8R60_06280 [Mycobacteriales bacterium]|nr:hypothetical protein [Mycobacteriales bacterium]